MGPCAASTGPNISVIVPSYLRPGLLAQCLDSVIPQVTDGDEVIVAVRSGDDETLAVASRKGAVVASTSQPGVLAAMRSGVQVAGRPVIAFLDDDVVIGPGWLEQVRSEYQSDPLLGGYGGRDIVHHGDDIVAGRAKHVGTLTKYGKPVGNHHVGFGEPRNVHVLKGCNCSYRTEALALPLHLRGGGAEVMHELATGLVVLAAGWKLVYDPTLTVDHYPGPRYDEDGRTAKSRRAYLDHTFNEALIIFSLRPQLRSRYRGYIFLVGHVASPGLIRALVGRIQGDQRLAGRFVATQLTVREALKASQRGELTMWQANDGHGADS